VAPSKMIFPVTVGGSILFLDQLSKYYIQKHFHLHESMVILGDFFSLTYIRNPGAAFGLFADQGPMFRTFFFLGVSMAALLFLALLFFQAHDNLVRMALSLVFGGAIGNLIDRIRFGEVIDFLDFYLGRFRWPAFNVADSAITVGVLLLVVYSLYSKRYVVPTGQ